MIARRRRRNLGRCGVLITALTAVALLFAPGASAAPQVNGIYDLGGEMPGELTEGPDGNIWVVLAGVNDIAKVTPDGTVTKYDAADVSSPAGITSGPDGNLWVTQSGGVAKIPPSNPTGATKFAIAEIVTPRGITTGPDGNLWAASGDKLIKIPPANPAGYDPKPITGMDARGIASQGNLLWIADFGGQRVVSATTAGVPTFYDVGGGPQEVVGGPGDQVLYSNQGTDPHTIGRIEPGGTAQVKQVPGADPFGVTFGPDGAYWIANFAGGNLGRMTPEGAYTTLGGLPANSGPRQVAAGPDDTLWVSLETATKVARVTGVEPVPPATKPTVVLKKTPKNKLKAGRKGAKAKYKFGSKPGGASFECKLKKKGKRNKREKKLAKTRSCSSPKTYKRLRKGKYTFAVTATLDGVKSNKVTDKFKVKKR